MDRNVMLSVRAAALKAMHGLHLTVIKNGCRAGTAVSLDDHHLPPNHHSSALTVCIHSTDCVCVCVTSIQAAAAVTMVMPYHNEAL